MFFLTPWTEPVAFGVFFSGHAEAMLVLESMRHDNRAEGVSVDFRRQGVKIWRTLRLLAECCCSGSCDYMVMFLYVMITIFQGIYPTNEKISEVRYIDALPILKLGGGFQHFLFSPLPGEDEPILTNIFPTGLVQPPTRKPFKTHQIHWLFGQVTIAAFWVSGWELFRSAATSGKGSCGKRGEFMMVGHHQTLGSKQP